MSTEIFSLEGKTALVTGSSTGLGKRMAVALGQAGAKVAMNYFNNEERAAEALSEFEATGSEGAMIRANVTEEADVMSLVDGESENSPSGLVAVCAPPGTCMLTDTRILHSGGRRTAVARRRSIVFTLRSSRPSTASP